MRNAFPYIVAGALGAATLFGGSAGAAGETTTPAPCDGVTITDPLGDARADRLPGLTPPQQASRADADNDIKDIFFTTRAGADGKLKTTAHMVVANVVDAPDESLQGIVRYVFDFATVENIPYARVTNAEGEWTFEYGHYPTTPAGEGTGLLEHIETTGAVVPGANGVVSLDLPEELSQPGVKLDKLFGRITLTGDEEEATAGYNSTDLAPDDGSASTKAYTVKECPAPPADPVVTTPVTTTPVTVTTTATAAPAAPATTTVKTTTTKKFSKRACRKAAKKIKNKRKRAKALKRCARKRR